MTAEFELQAASRGLATEFSKSDQPVQFAGVMENRFINLDGDSEMRPGLNNLLNPYDVSGTFGDWDGKVHIIHEHVKRNGSTIQFATRYEGQNSSTGEIDPADERKFFLISKKDSSTGVWETVNVHNGADAGADMGGALTLGFDYFHEFNNPSSSINDDSPQAVQFSDKSIFVGNNISPYYYDESLDKIFPLNSVMVAGQASGGSSATVLTDANVTNWANETDVAPNDLLYNATRNAWAIITSVGSTNLDHTAIASAGSVQNGLGATNSPYNSTGIGGSQSSGDRYEIWDLLENNFFPVDPNQSRFDNVVVAAAGTNIAEIEVSSNLLTASNTVLRPGDYVYNATQNGVLRVADIDNRTGGNPGLYMRMVASSDFNAQLTGQAAGDTLIFMKSAVPIASYAHVHYGRLYLVDSREKNRVFPSAPDDCRDFTTYQEELQTSTLDYGAKQPKGEEILQLDTFQRYLVAAGRRNIYISQGVDPIIDASGGTSDLQPVGLFTQGAASRKCLANIGSDMLYGALDGLRRFKITDILAVDTDNGSEVIKRELRQALEANGLLEKDIQVIHYPRRNWVMFKVGNVIYNFNYTAVYQQGELIRGGSWSKFTGRLAECHSFLLRSNGDLNCAWFDENDQITYFFEFDKGSYDDGIAFESTAVSQPINTDYETAWLGPGNGRMIHNRYVRPFIESDAEQNFTFSIIADLEEERIDDTITVSAAGGGVIIQNWQVGVSPIGAIPKTSRDKHALRTYTDYFKLRVTTSGGVRNTLSKFIFYGNPYETR